MAEYKSKFTGAEIDAGVEAALMFNGVEPAEDDVPKVFIDGEIPTTKDDVLAELTYISKSKTFHTYIKIKCQGSSSMAYPKKNFTVKLYSDETRTTEQSELFKDWGVESSKFVLKANYIDHSHARNIICARLWDEVVSSRADYDTLPAEMRNSPRNGAIDGFPIKVYTNGTYQGIYTWNIGKDAWMWGMNESNSNHVLLCGETNTDGVYAENACNFRALWSGVNEDNWSVEVGTNSDAVKNSLNALISCVKDTDDETFKSTIGAYLDVQSAIDYYLHQYVICGIDGLAKNMLLATYDGVKWICGAYDMDGTIGLTFWGGTGVVNPYYKCPEQYQEQFSLLWERLEVNFVSELKERYETLRTSVYSVPNMYTHFERFMDIIGQELYAEDLTIYEGIPSGDTNNIQYMRNFIQNRLDYVDTQIATLGEEEVSEYLYVLPSPTTFDGVDDYIDTGVQLLNEPRDFTIYVDINRTEAVSGKTEALFDVIDETYIANTLAINGENNGWTFRTNDITHLAEDSATGWWDHSYTNTKTFVLVFKDGIFSFGKYYRHDSGREGIRYIAPNNATYVPNTGSLIIGGRGLDYNNWKGTINDFRIYNRAMTEDEAIALINSANA